MQNPNEETEEIYVDIDSCVKEAEIIVNFEDRDAIKKMIKSLESMLLYDRDTFFYLKGDNCEIMLSSHKIWD